jgi:hypothetical protein
MTTTIDLRKLAGAIAAVAAVSVMASACDFLDVSNPGPIADENLNVPEAVPGIVAGMAGDISSGLDDLIQDGTAIMADELVHGGSYTDSGLFFRGIIRDTDVNGIWANMQTARWTAEHGIERIRTVLEDRFESNPNVPRAYFLAGIANRTLGEHVCATAIDGGPEQPNTVHFERAEQHFTEAIRLATAQNNTAVRLGALAGRATARAWQGKWNEAAQDAQLVPTNHVTLALYAPVGREQNQIYQETHVRFEITVYNTVWATVSRDPRVPWDTLFDASGRVPRAGQDGRTPHFRQRKYTSFDADIPLVKGTEMRVLEAEARLRQNDIAGAFALLNTMRAFYTGLAPLPVPTTIADAWRTLQRERGAVVWLESRRLWDLRRWNAETGPANNTFLNDRDKCIPISRDERLSNPNLER